MKVALINPSIKYSISNEIMDPIGLLYIGTVLKNQHHDVRIFDEAVTDNALIIDAVKKFDPKVIGISTMTATQVKGESFARELKREDNTVVFGGYHPSMMPELVRLPYIDFVVRKQGEYTFSELISSLEKGMDFQDMNGIAYMDGSKLRINPPSEKIHDLDKLPVPDRNLIDMSRYYAKAVGTLGLDEQVYATINASRGCPHDCNFCVTNKMNNGWVQRSVDSVLDELEELVNSGVNTIFFRDEDFTIRKKRVMKICKGIISRGLDFSWYAFARIDEVDAEMLNAMKRSGCTDLQIGYETGSKSIDLNKRLKKEPIEQSRLIYDSGIRIHALMMMGMPRDTRETLEETREFLEKIPYYRVRMAFATAFPGARLYDEVIEKDLLLTEDFSKYDTETPTIKCGLSPEELIQFRDSFTQEVYSSPEYIERAKKYLIEQPESRGSLIQWFESVGVEADVAR